MHLKHLEHILYCAHSSNSKLCVSNCKMGFVCALVGGYVQISTHKLLISSLIDIFN